MKKGQIYCYMADGSERRWLKEEKGFNFLRGIENKDKIMGIAKDNNGALYVVRVTSCGLPVCSCGAKAELIN